MFFFLFVVIFIMLVLLSFEYGLIEFLEYLIILLFKSVMFIFWVNLNFKYLLVILKNFLLRLLNFVFFEVFYLIKGVLSSDLWLVFIDLLLLVIMFLM